MIDKRRGAVALLTLFAVVTTTAHADTSALQKRADADSSFGFRMLGKLVTEKPQAGNIFISPLSLTGALALAYNGAAGETRDEIADVLGVTTDSMEAADTGFLDLTTSLKAADPNVEIDVANAVWVRSGEPLNSEYKARCEHYLGASVGDLDLRAPQAVDTINSWVSKNTKGKISSIVSQEQIQHAVFVLTNAVYFHGEWSVPFDPSRTAPSAFHGDTGSQTVPMMHSTGRTDYAEDSTMQLSSLPYGNGRLRMVIALPKEGTSIESVASTMTWDHWTDLMSELKPRELTLALPRFKASYLDPSMSQPLKELGMKKAFDGGDFSPMGLGNTAVSQVIHRAILEVDEHGSTAAAVTGIIGAKDVMVHQLAMTVDHPFLCAIEDSQTGDILFIGVIRHPEE